MAAYANEWSFGSFNSQWFMADGTLVAASEGNDGPGCGSEAGLTWYGEEITCVSGGVLWWECASELTWSDTWGFLRFVNLLDGAAVVGFVDGEAVTAPLAAASSSDVGESWQEAWTVVEHDTTSQGNHELCLEDGTGSRIAEAPLAMRQGHHATVVLAGTSALPKLIQLREEPYGPLPHGHRVRVAHVGADAVEVAVRVGTDDWVSLVSGEMSDGFVSESRLGELEVDLDADGGVDLRYVIDLADRGWSQVYLAPTSGGIDAWHHVVGEDLVKLQ